MIKLLLAVLLGAALPARAGTRVAGLLSAQGVNVLDATNAPRQIFSSNETIGFSQTIFNGALSPNRTAFSFAVFAPNGNKTFTQSGNAVPGSVGNAAAQISGVAIAGFYQGPGVYTLKAYANLDGVTIEQDKSFTISSPNILLIYPPNGATGLTDNPLTFQWFSSGASSYRITISDNPGLYNPIQVQSVPGGSNSFTYPQNPNPIDPRSKLSAGQVYYWKVEGLDTNLNAIAASPVPFSFSVASTALTRDLAVTDLSASGSPDAGGNIPFTVTVKDQGSTTETGVQLKFTVGGLPAAASPITLPALSPGDQKTIAVSAPIPTDMNTALAIACLTIFDDDSTNNCKTMSVTRAVSLSTSASSFSNTGAGLQSADQIWQAIENILQAQGTDLSDYNLVSMEGSLTRDELTALLDQLRAGQASAIVSGPALPPPTVSTAAISSFMNAIPDDGRPPEPPSEDAGAAAGAQSPDEILRTLDFQLKAMGLDLSGYQIKNMDGSLTRDELMSLIDQLRSGTATATLSGPALSAASATAPGQNGEPPKESPEAATPLPGGADDQEWSGYSRPLSPRTEGFSVTDEARWKKLWGRLSDAPVPTVDFARERVLAILSGRGVRADRIEIVGVLPSGTELVVRYKLVTYARMGRPDAPPLEDLGGRYAPYLLKAVPNEVSKVRFVQVKENDNE